MNAYSIIYVNQHLETLREDAARRRSERAVDGPSLRDRIGSAMARISSAIDAAAGPDWSFLPKIHDYPYRG